jgi:hypothetical protein
MPFILTLRVDSRKIPSVLEGLEAGRLTTIYKVHAATVDSDREMRENGYVYGDKVPVTHLVLEGESLLLRKWTVPLMPPEIKKMLDTDGSQKKAEEEAAAAAAAEAAAGG